MSTVSAFPGPQQPSPGDTTRRQVSDVPVALITGASRGLGAALAEALAGHGWHLVLLARDKSGLEAVDDAVRARGGSATLIPADLTKSEETDRLGAALAQRFGRLDLWIATAARLEPLGPAAQIEARGLQAMLALHVTATSRLIRSLEPLMRATPDARALVMTCEIAREPRAHWGAYGATKAAQAALVGSWAAECVRIGPAVTLVDPGAMATRLHALAFPGIDPASIPSPADVAARLIKEHALAAPVGQPARSSGA